jgi:diadenosine tetraphosphate (Ap4A) HIT family hydrolase
MLHNSDCLSCAVVRGERAILGGTIIETGSFHAHQDVAYPVPGLVIVASKRHIKCFDELSEAEATELALLVRRIRAKQREVLGVEHVYYFYNEDTSHHFHLWMVPRYDWMQEFGRSVESLRPALVHAREQMSSPEELAVTLHSVEHLRKALNVNNV